MRQPIRSRQNQQQQQQQQSPNTDYQRHGDGSAFSDNTRLINDYQQQPRAQAVTQQYGTAALDTEADIQRQKLEGIRDIDAETREVKALAEDFALLVDTQQTGIDQIGKNVDNSVKHVESGNEQLKKASETQKSSRKWMCATIVCVFVIVAIIIIVLFVMKKL